MLRGTPPNLPREHGRSIAAVLVAYRPSDDLVRNVEAVLAHTGSLLLVDNTPGGEPPEPIERADRLRGVRVLRYGENRGLGVALNAGVAHARAQGAAWLLTMDQDSLLRPGWAAGVRAALAEGGDQTAAVGVGYQNPTFTDAVPESHERAREVNAVITSGSVWSVRHLTALGGFREDYLVDNVDTEMCFRARSQGLRVLKSGGILMDHTLGDLRWATWFGRPFHCAGYGPVRCYYIFRNFVDLWRRYGRHERRWVRDHTRWLGWLVKSSLAEGRVDNLRAMAVGLADGLRQRLGSAPPSVGGT